METTKPVDHSQSYLPLTPLPKSKHNCWDSAVERLSSIWQSIKHGIIWLWELLTRPCSSCLHNHRYKSTEVKNPVFPSDTIGIIDTKGSTSSALTKNALRQAFQATFPTEIISERAVDALTAIIIASQSKFGLNLYNLYKAQTAVKLPQANQEPFFTPIKIEKTARGIEFAFVLVKTAVTKDLTEAELKGLLGEPDPNYTFQEIVATSLKTASGTEIPTIQIICTWNEAAAPFPIHTPKMTSPELAIIQGIDFTQNPDEAWLRSNGVTDDPASLAFTIYNDRVEIANAVQRLHPQSDPHFTTYTHMNSLGWQNKRTVEITFIYAATEVTTTPANATTLQNILGSRPYYKHKETSIMVLPGNSGGQEIQMPLVGITYILDLNAAK